jgi:hypothetical protein
VASLFVTHTRVCSNDFRKTGSVHQQLLHCSGDVLLLRKQSYNESGIALAVIIITIQLVISPYLFGPRPVYIKLNLRQYKFMAAYSTW